MPGSEPYSATYFHSKGRKLGLPIAGNFEITSRCNFNCPMCYVHHPDADLSGELSTSQLLSIAEKARDRGMIFALLTGGEPFVRRDFFEIYDGMKRLGLLISINSNGSLISGEILDRLAVDPPCRINITLYGGSEDTYCRMCGNSAFERVTENIREIKRRGIDVRLNVSITPYNRGDLERIFRISRDIDVHVKMSSYMYPPIRIEGNGGERMSPEEAAECFVEYDRLRFADEEFAKRAENMKKGVSIREDCPVDPSAEGVLCRAGSTSFWLTWDGKMLPCGMFPYPSVDVLSEGFDKAWDTIRRSTAAIRLPAKCSSCPKKEMCSVCAAVCMSEKGSFDAVPEYVCRMTDEIYRLTVADIHENTDQER